jgi:hypothetical protein
MEINSKTTKAELLAYIEQMEAKMAQIEQEVKEKKETPVNTAPVQPVQSAINIVAPSTDVRIVYCSESMGYAEISTMKLHFNRYGDTYTLNRSQFDELVGKYRHWFDRGVLAVASMNADVALEKGLPLQTEYGLTADTLKSIGKMSATEIEKLWNETTLKAHRDSIICYVKAKIIQGDRDFKTREKIDLFNRLTDGAFRREQDELDGRLKYSQVDFNKI